MTQVSVHSADQPGAVQQAGLPRTPLVEGQPPGPVERVMSTLIRKLAWSRLSNPKVAVTLSGAGLLLGMLRRGDLARTPRRSAVRLPLSLLPSLEHQTVLASVMLYTADDPGLPGAGRDAVGAQPGLAAQPAAPAAGQRGHRRRSWSASPRSARRTWPATRPTAGSPRWAGTRTPPARWPGWAHTRRTRSAVGTVWKTQPSVYGPFATVIQCVRGRHRRAERRHHRLDADDPQRDRLHRRRLCCCSRPPTTRCGPPCSGPRTRS